MSKAIILLKTEHGLRHSHETHWQLTLFSIFVWTVIQLLIISNASVFQFLGLKWAEVQVDQIISWASKPGLVVAQGATGHKNKFRTL